MSPTNVNQETPLTEIGPNSAGLQILLLTGAFALAARNLVTQVVVFPSKALSLFLQSVDITLLGLKLLLQTSNLTHVTSLCKTSGILAARLLVAFEKLDTVFKAEGLKDHGVGAVEDKRQEESESTEVHVALRVELAGLDFRAVGTEGGTSHISTLFREGGHLQLYPVHPVDAVNEQDEDEDKCDPQTILQLRDYRAFRDEGEKLTPDSEGKGYDQAHEDAHLEDEKAKDKTVVKRHFA